MIIKEIFAILFFALSCIFGIAGLIGMFRFHDPYSKLQAGSLCGTISVFSVFLGVIFLSPNTAVTGRLIIIAIFFLISAPTGSHIVARFAWNAGIIPWNPNKNNTFSRKEDE